jgi:hypothetical protein
VLLGQPAGVGFVAQDAALVILLPVNAVLCHSLPLGPCTTSAFKSQTMANGLLPLAYSVKFVQVPGSVPYRVLVLTDASK